MKRRQRLRLKVVALVCALLVLIVSAIPFFSKSTDARLLGLIFGAFGSGAMLSDLIHDVWKDRRKGEG